MKDSQTSQIFEVEYFKKVIFHVAGSYTTKSTYRSTSRVPPPQKYEITWVMVPGIPDVNVDLSKLGPMEEKELEVGSVWRRLKQRKAGAILSHVPKCCIVLILAGIELILFLIAGKVLWFGFSRRIM